MPNTLAHLSQVIGSTERTPFCLAAKGVVLTTGPRLPPTYHQIIQHFSQVIKATERTLFCLDAKGVVLTRIWCLFEVWHTVLAGGAPKLLVLANQVRVGGKVWT